MIEGEHFLRNVDAPTSLVIPSEKYGPWKRETQLSSESRAAYDQVIRANAPFNAMVNEAWDKSLEYLRLSIWESNLAAESMSQSLAALYISQMLLTHARTLLGDIFGRP